MNRLWLQWIYSFLAIAFLSCANPNEGKGLQLLDPYQNEYVSLVDISRSGGVVVIYVNKDNLCSCQFDLDMLGKVESWYPDAVFITVVSGISTSDDLSSFPSYGQILLDPNGDFQKKMQLTTREALLMVFDREGSILMGLPLGSQSEEVNQAQKLLLQVSLKGA